MTERSKKCVGTFCSRVHKLCMVLFLFLAHSWINILVLLYLFKHVQSLVVRPFVTDVILTVKSSIAF